MTVISFLNTLLLLGAIQGFIAGLVLFSASKEKRSVRLIAWLLFIMALASFKIYLINVGAFSSQAGMLIDALVPFIIIMPVGPLIYFYCKAELDPGFTIRRKDRKHFFPVVIDLFNHISALVFIFILLLGLANPHENSFGTWFDAYNVYADIPRWISLTVYVGLSYRLLRNLRIQEVGIGNWLKEFIWVFIAFDVLWLLHLAPYVIPHYTDVILSEVGWYPIYIPLVGIVYWLGIRGFQISFRQLRLSKTTEPVPDEICDQVLQKITIAMSSDKLYLDPELSLARLAGHVGVGQKVVSYVLNRKTGKGFNEYVNQFRIAEVKLRLTNADLRKFTIASVAYDCGFNSQPTFQRAFKSIVGLTPREFIHREK